MDFLSLLRMMGALLIVLGILAGGLWAVRRYDLRWPGALTAGLRARDRIPRLALVERLALDARRSVVLIRRDGHEHLLLISPEGMLIVETGIALSPTKTFQEEVAAHD